MKVAFIAQVSPELETCTRCAQLGRTVPFIFSGVPHVVLIEGDDDLDHPARVTLCETCALFVRDAIEEPAPKD